MQIISKIKRLFFVQVRIWKYNFLSDCNNIIGKPNIFHPILLKGEGQISFGNNVQMGVISSPYYFSNYSYLEVRNKNSVIKIGNNVTINNMFSAVAFDSIEIRDNVIAGVNFCIIDSDGHNLNPDFRMDFQSIQSKSVLIEENVFIGDNVSILKGVKIGKNSVIGFGSVITTDIPENVIAAGNPAKVIRNL